MPALPALDPQSKAQMIAAAGSMPDQQAEDLLDVVDATPYGGKQRLIRYGIGAAGGLILGVIVGKLLG